MINTIKKYISPVSIDSNHRFKSWEHCYYAFNKTKDIDILSLNLSFYLASWGMYRGSSGLLWKDFKVHYPAVKMLQKYYDLRAINWNRPEIGRIIELKENLIDIYSEINYLNGKSNIPQKISPTETLISKILLGSLGCIPAFDRYFNYGLYKKHNISVNKESLNSIYSYIDINKILKCQKYIYTKIKFRYPVMKIVDMYFWQRGYNELKK